MTCPDSVFAKISEAKMVSEIFLRDTIYYRQPIWLRGFSVFESRPKTAEARKVSRRHIMYMPSGRLTRLLRFFRRLSAVFPGVVGFIQVFKIAVFIEVFR